MSPPRLLHIRGTAPLGGDALLIVELGRAARERGFEVDVLATDPRFRELIREARLGLVDLDVIRREIRPLWDAGGLMRLTAFLARSRYSIVHTHTSKPGIVGRLAATWIGAPAIIHTAHLFPFHEQTGRLATAAYVRAERLAARWCDRIVTVSEFHRDWAIRMGIGRPDQVVAIPNGVPVERARAERSPAEVRAELGVGDSFLALSTGRLAEQKGLEYLIRAAALVRADAPSVRFVIAGDGPLEQPLAQLVADLGLGGTVKLVGFRPDIGNLLAASDLVVLPSLWEGLPVSLLEAMAAGKPVVTTAVGGNREVTNDGDAAVLVPPKDPATLASAIRALASDLPRLEELGRRGREVQRERYTLGRMLESYVYEYERLLGKRSPRAPVSLFEAEGVS